MYIAKKITTKGSLCKISHPKCFKIKNFDRFHREAMGRGGGVRGLDSNYAINNQCFWRVITLYNIGITYTCKLYSLFQFTV